MVTLRNGTNETKIYSHAMLIVLPMFSSVGMPQLLKLTLCVSWQCEPFCFVI